ncbi:Cytochrome c-type protein TorY [Candidatus Terasakiella magnetica]|uniref:Cytochrome c-type protein n=1 Tax=Candidatus Terasakiella magnetica TaxID=1867952 RepID=A0A1C3RHS3_9PROT|nr:NapC/NirT family cytochrome c [Candidatus Terasakiella magnetica]SCA56833.1 Cytochrome c-type protein TorY [Candidatus Terasakiella magnetica]
MKDLWNWFWTSSNRLFFAGVLFIAGVVAWGSFNTFMEYTNRMDFCISCHEMEENVYADYKRTIHFQNGSGVRASCSDCHVPKEWGAKLVRKIKASRELVSTMTGKISTPEKFEEHRFEMAQNVWREMRANGSRECKNCHSYEAMHADKQSKRAQKAMNEAATTDVACIDCHKGIAHRLPRFDKVYEKWAVDVKKAVAANSLSASKAFVAASVNIHLEQNEASAVLAQVNPLSELEVLEKSGAWAKVKLNAWGRDDSFKLYAKAGPQYDVAMLESVEFDVVKQAEQRVDEETGLTWHKATLEGWVKYAGKLSDDSVVIKDYARKLWEADCGLCHTIYKTTGYSARDWTKHMKSMSFYSTLDNDQLILVLKFLQSQSSDVMAKK